MRDQIDQAEVGSHVVPQVDDDRKAAELWQDVDADEHAQEAMPDHALAAVRRAPVWESA